LRRARHLRGDPASGRHEGIAHDRRHQQGSRRADLRGRRLRDRRRSLRDRTRDRERAQTVKSSTTEAGAFRPMATLTLWILVLIALTAFGAQVAARVRLIAAAPSTFALDHP